MGPPERTGAGETGEWGMRRWIGRIALLLAALLLVVALAAWWLLRGSLPRLEGEAGLAGLSAPVAIERDALGVVTIDAASRADAMRALGYVHAQERYFEMDLMRRDAAGELAALFGPRALDHDRARRVHRMRARVEAGLERILGPHAEEVDAYVAGVNAGLGDLRMRPWPYLLLRRQPSPWTQADSPLVGLAMYFELQDAGNARELALWRVRPHLPPALYALLAHDGSSWDAPLQGEARGDAVLPGPDTLDLRALPAPIQEAAIAAKPLAPSPASRAVRACDAQAARLHPASRESGIADSPAAPRFPRGSNNFAVAGTLTGDGRALVADDMHLGLRAPNLWFRVRLRYPDPRAPGGRVDVAGFSLPGLPGVVVGSNGHVAWGFTNSYGDWADWRLEPGCAEDCAAARTHVERIEVAGGEAVELEVRQTGWGPLLHETGEGDALALRWAAHLPGALDFGLMDFAHAGTLDRLFARADRAAMPAQNLVAGDAAGRIGWRLLGAMPRRAAGCHRHVVEPGSPCGPWPLANGDNPAIVDPPQNRLWTANSRVVDGEALEAIGDGGYMLGVRAWMIRDRLTARRRFDEADLLAIQLDDRALFLERWWRLLREQADAAGTPALRALADADPQWPARAVGDTASYRIVRAWRLAVHARIADGLLAPARAALGPEVPMPALPQFEGVAWPLATQRPPHLLPRRFACGPGTTGRASSCSEAGDGDPLGADDDGTHGWQALFEDAAREVRDELAAHGPLHQRTWAERNTAAICQPLAAAVPLVGRRFLCMPREPLAGDTLTPRAQSPSGGASQRMVVAPGREDRGLAHMPGGQSGHPLSPFWGAGHDDWVHGRPTPFLPGEARHRLQLMPANRAP
jgi:penicillin G amidase